MLKKLIASICMICIISDILSVCVGAEDISGGKLLEAKYKAYIEEQQQMMEEECKKVEERYERIQKTKEYFEAYPNGNGTFVKSYYDENYNYVIQVKNAVTDQNLKDYIDKNNARIQYVKYSEEELEEIEQKCANTIISYSNKVSLKDSELNEFLNSNSEIYINYEDNCIDIYVNDKSDEAVQELRKIVNDEAVRFVEKSQVEPTATTIQLGRGCYFPKANGYVSASIGYRAKMTELSTGKVFYGFVCCGHMIHQSIRAGYEVYLDKALTQKIGKIKLITCNSDTACDYSFIEVNSDYTMSNRVYYSTSYGKTGDGTTLSNAYATEQELVSAQDAKVNIYKSGAASYLTSGEIISARRAIAMPNIFNKKKDYLSKMVVSKTYVTEGDSGGVAYAYMKHNGQYVWTIIGTVTGSDDSSGESFFQPAYRNLFYYSTYKIVPY